MKLLFIIERPLYYKFFGALINYFERGGDSCFLIHRYSYQVKVNHMSFPYLFLSSGRDEQTFYFKENCEIIKFVNKYKIDVVFSLHSLAYYQLTRKNLKYSKWCILQHGFDLLLERDDIFSADHIFLYTKAWIEEFFKGTRHSDQSNRDKLHFTGIPQFDVLKCLDFQRLRDRYALDDEKKLLVYFPLDQPANYVQLCRNFTEKIFTLYHFPVPTNKKEKLFKILSSFFFSQKSREEEILKAIRKFCDHNKFHFFVKSRFKRILPEFYQSISDMIIYDDSYYPPSIMEILYLSDIAITTLPCLAVSEGIATKNFNIIINIEENLQRSLNTFYEKEFGMDSLEVFFPAGNCWNPGIREFIKSFSKADCHEYIYRSEPGKMYLNKYFNPENSADSCHQIHEILRK